MNRIVLIGNGFDLAHSLETRYSDFIFWYLKNLISDAITAGAYDDGLINFSEQDCEKLKISLFSLENCKNPNEIIQELKKIKIELNYKSDFFKNLITQYCNSNWVDIEFYYFQEIQRLFNNYQKQLERENSTEQIINAVQQLNEKFHIVRCKLENYLEKVQQRINKIQIDPKLEEIFFGPIKASELQKRYDFGGLQDEKFNIKQVYFVNFNYTNLIGRYTDKFRPSQSLDIKNIHGQIGDPNNPIIFGYGDHHDDSYSEIENSNQRDFLRNIKYFNYLKSHYYHQIMNFIHKDHFQVVVIGHSLGVSDRTMLKRILEDERCVSIKVYGYEKEDGTDDFLEKMIEISRHFKDKAVMLEKVVHFHPELLLKIDLR